MAYWNITRHKGKDCSFQAIVTDCKCFDCTYNEKSKQTQHPLLDYKGGCNDYSKHMSSCESYKKSSSGAGWIPKNML